MKLHSLACSALTLSLSLSACRPVVAPAAEARPIDSLPARATSVASPPAAEPIPWLAALAAPVCIVPAPVWFGDLRLRSGRDPFATISRGPAKILLGGAAHGGASQAAVEGDGLRVLGVVDRPTLYLAKPMLLSKVVVPRASTPVTWFETTTPDRVGVSLDVSDTFLQPTTAEAVAPCSALTGTEPAFDARAFAAPPSRKTATVRSEAMLLPSIGDQGGPLLNGAYGSRADIVETKGDMTRVVIEHHRYWAVGWLPTAALSQSHVARAPRVMMGATYYAGTGDKHCGHDVALMVSVAGERAFIGTLRAGASFNTSTLDVEPGFVALTVFEQWFHLQGDAKLLVRAEDLDGC